MSAALRTLDAGLDLEPVHARVEPGRRIPLVGAIAADEPLPAVQVLETLQVPPRVSRRQGDVFGLRVRGNSMADDGIFDGDHILVAACAPVRDGQTVVAEVDGHPTVKRWHREPGGRVRLQPANERVLPLIVRSSRVRLHGVVVGVLRKHGFARTGRPSRASALPEPRQPRVPGGQLDPLNLALRIVEHNLTEWERLVARSSVRSARSAGEDGRTLAQSLRVLHATYVATESPRLRRALLDEAARISRQMRAVAARLGWGRCEIRPLDP